MEFWKLLVLFSCAFFGGLAIFFVKNNKAQFLKLILSFSGSYLFAITVLHLIPDAYSGADKNEIGIFILTGFLFQVLLEQFSKGVEHGHIHKYNYSHTFPLGIMVSLCLHGFLEGMPLAKDHHNELIFGIALHHIPAAFSLTGILVQNRYKASSVLLCAAVFALMAPLGYYFSINLSNGNIHGMEPYFNKVMGIVIGIFLHISTTILFESNANHKINFKKMMAILLGILAALIGFYASKG